MEIVKEARPSELFNAFNIFSAVILEKQKRGQTTFPYNFGEFNKAFYDAYLKNSGLMQDGFTENGHYSQLILRHAIRMSHLTQRIKIRLKGGLADIVCLNGLAEPAEEVKSVARHICDYLDAGIKTA